MFSAIRNKFIYLLLHGLGVMPLGLARTLGTVFGHLSWSLSSRERWVTEKNIDLCFPQLTDAERQALAKASLLETSRLALEILVVWQHGEAWCRRKTLKVEGEQLLRQALAMGKGTIFVAPHLGNWEFLGKNLTAYGPLTNLYQPPKQVILDPFIKSARERLGAKLVPTNKRGVAAILACLKRGELSGILPDQVPDHGGGEYATFFGQYAFTMTLLHGLVQRTGCRVLMAFAKRVSGGFELYFREPDPAIYSEDKQQSLEALNRSIELLVNEAPEQYQWEYKRFRKQPEAGAGKALYFRAKK